MPHRRCPMLSSNTGPTENDLHTKSKADTAEGRLRPPTEARAPMSSGVCVALCLGKSDCTKSKENKHGPPCSQQPPDRLTGSASVTPKLNCTRYYTRPTLSTRQSQWNPSHAQQTTICIHTCTCSAREGLNWSECAHVSGLHCWPAC